MRVLYVLYGLLVFLFFAGVANGKEYCKNKLFDANKSHWNLPDPLPGYPKKSVAEAAAKREGTLGDWVEKSWVSHATDNPAGTTDNPVDNSGMPAGGWARANVPPAGPSAPALTRWTGFKFGNADAPDQDADLTSAANFHAKINDKKALRYTDFKTRLKLDNHVPPTGIYFLVNGPGTGEYSNYPSPSHREAHPKTILWWRFRKSVADFPADVQYWLVCNTGGFPGEVHIVATNNALVIAWLGDHYFEKLAADDPLLQDLPAAGVGNPRRLKVPTSYVKSNGEKEKVDVNIFYSVDFETDHFWAFTGTETVDYVSTDKSLKKVFLSVTEDVDSPKNTLEPL